MKHSRLLFALSVAACCSLWLGCGSLLAPLPDNTRYYVLTSGEGRAPATPAPPASSPLVVGLGPISLPGYLDRQQIATRVNPNRLDYSDNDLWAQPLSANFTQVLGQNLASLVRASQIVDYPWYSTQPMDYAVQVRAAHFECAKDGDCQLDATWSIVEPRSGKVLRRQHNDLVAPAGGGDPSAKVAALSRVLFQMSQQIAQALRQLVLTRVAAAGS
jgi:uncharacterized lipoprotein YmbA